MKKIINVLRTALLKVGSDKTFRIMKFASLLLLVTIFNAFGSETYSQFARLNLDMKDVPIQAVLNAIEGQSEFFFLYSSKIIDVIQKVNIHAESKNITEVLDELLADTDIKFAVKDRQILLVNKEPELTNLLQQNRVTGKVVDDKGNPLPGVAVLVKGTTQGTLTDVSGNYTLDNLPPNAILIFSFVGFTPREVIVSDQAVININMEQDIFGLEEVVVVGYGVQKRRNVVGSVASVRGEKLLETSTIDPVRSMAGRLPGVEVRTASGEPGSETSTIRVRGRTSLGGTSPLIVIDGVPGRSLTQIDPLDIEDITVLKDASAAIYGASAANGVILVTTKRGKSDRLRVTLDSYQGFMAPTVVPQVLDAAEYAIAISEYQIYKGEQRRYTDKDIELFRSGVDPWKHPNTDWMDVLVSDWTTKSKHSIMLDGTFKDKLDYLFSFGYRNEEDIYKQDRSANYNQYNVRAKFDATVTRWMKIFYDFAGFQNNRIRPYSSASSIYGGASRFYPTLPAFWPTGEVGPDVTEGNTPVITSTMVPGYDKSTDYQTQNTLAFQLDPIKNLSIKGTYSLDVDIGYNKNFIAPWYVNFADESTAVDTNGDGYIDYMQVKPSLRSPSGISSPQLTEAFSRTIRKYSLLSASYDKVFGDHHVSLFGAAEYLGNDRNDFSAFRKYYISTKIQTLNAGGNEEKNNSGSVSIYARLSYIGRLLYNYKEKYLAEITFRRDGSLKYPPETRWGNFPSIFLGWRASEEDFWQGIAPFVNNFKLRAGFGKMGMDPGAAFQYLNSYGVTPGLTLGDKTVESAVYQIGVANPDITWEKEDTYNVGFESNYLNNTFDLEVDLFYKKRYDILAKRDASVPRFTGISLPDENIAEVDNRGFEIVAGYNEEFGQHLKLNLSGNISYSKNKVVYMDEPARKVPWQEREGRPYGAILLYESIGVFADKAAVDAYPHWLTAKAGDIIFRDVDGNDKIDADDKILLDRADGPLTLYGASLNLTYKNWSLFVMAQGQGKFFQLSQPGDNVRGLSGNYYRWMYDNRWTLGELPGVEKNIYTNVPRPWDRGNEYWNWRSNDNTYWYFNSAFCRLKSLALTYSVPKNLIGTKIGLYSANIFLKGDNLFLIYSAHRYFDPEVSQVETYPLTRSLSVGVNLIF